MKNVLITGAGGLLGKQVCKDLRDIGLNVYPILRKKIPDSQDDPNVLFADISTINWVKELPKDIDTVMHFANSSLFREFPEGMQNVLDINIKSTIELLEWSRVNKVKKFVFTSTGNVYQESHKKLTEESLCLPNSMYAASKLSSEYFVEMYSMFFRTLILRPFGIYGSQQKHGLFFEIIKRVKDCDPIILDKGIGLEITPIHVSDASQAIIYLTNNHNSSKNHLLLNLASNEKTNVKRIADIASNYLGQMPIFVENNILNKSFIADVTLLKNMWPVQERTYIKEGIKKFIADL